MTPTWVTEIIRGDDLVPPTPRQLLWDALALPPPALAHVPLVVGPDGCRLAKRHGDTWLTTVRAAGVQPKALLGLLVWSCGWCEPPERVTAHHLLSRFRLSSIPPRPFVLGPDHLLGLGNELG
jgi:glutamyl-tRNA synthetase